MFVDVGRHMDRDLVLHELGHLLQSAEMGCCGGRTGTPGAVSEHIANLNIMWSRVYDNDNIGLERSDWVCVDLTTGLLSSGLDKHYGDPRLIHEPDGWWWYEDLAIQGTAIHRNDSILNKMAYLLMRRRGEGPQLHYGVDVHGFGPAAAKMFYLSIAKNRFGQGADFLRYRDGLAVTCATEYPYSPEFAGHLNDAWNSVGLWSSPEEKDCKIDGRPAAVCPEMRRGRFWIYVFYKVKGARNISYRRLDPLTGDWTEEAPFGSGSADETPQTDLPVAAVAKRDKIVVFYVDHAKHVVKYVQVHVSSSGHLYVHQPFSVSNPRTGWVAQTDVPVAVATSDDFLTLLYKEKGGTQVFTARSRLSAGPLLVDNEWEPGPAPPAAFRTHLAPCMTEYVRSEEIPGNSGRIVRTVAAAAITRHDGGIVFALYDDVGWYRYFSSGAAGGSCPRRGAV